MSNTEYGLVIIKDYEDGRTFDRLLVPADKVEEVYNIIQACAEELHNHFKEKGVF